MTRPLTDDRSPLRERVVTVVTVVAPVGAVALAAWQWARHGIGLAPLVLCGVMYLLTIIGIGAGFHRLFTHRSFQCGSALRWFFGIAGSMAAQGPLLFWVACHRRHHRHSDEAGDPHSPHFHGEGIWGVLGGWWHAHVGWMFSYQPENYFKLTHDLVRDPVTLALHRGYLFWVAGGLILPGLVGLAWTGHRMDFWAAVLWGGFVRMFLVHHATWCVNSICHLFGRAPHDTGDHSRNNLLVALFTLGEGWHNNHHAFPSLARHGLTAGQIDVSFLLLRGLEALGLVWSLRLPDSEK